MKIKQTILGLALAAALVLPASAADVLSVNGQNLWTQAKARLVGGNTTYVSLRTVAGALAPDAAVKWLPVRYTVIRIPPCMTTILCGMV